MKIENHNTVVRTSIDAEAISLGIDLSGMNHVMSILSNLYSNAPLAVLREYCTNARDSHVQAGNPDPIQVTSPTELLPQLTIQDFGIGMSSDDIKDVYTKYGSSTKRDSNDQVGAFGIGSKSAFTISSQFTVTGVKSGVRTIVLFSLTEDNTPVYQVLSKEFVQEPNSVKVSIPIDNVNQMRETIRTFFYTWKPGTVLVDGQTPENLWGDKKVIPLGQDTYLKVADPDIPSWSRRTTTQIVMGGVAYPVEDQITRRAPKVHQGATVYVEVPIGAVDIAPSRESLKDSPRTIELVEKALDTFHAALTMSEDADIALHKDSPAKSVWAMRRWGEIRGLTDWDHQMKRWGLTPLKATDRIEDPTGGPVRFEDSAISRHIAFDKKETPLSPHLIRHFLVVTGCDKPNKVRLVYNRAEKWRREYHKSDTILIPAFRDAGGAGWLRFGPNVEGGVPTIDYKQFKEEAAELYRKANPYGSGPAVTYYEIRIGQGTARLEAVDNIIEELDGRRLVLLDNWRNFLTFLDDNYVQVRCHGKQKYDVMVKRLSEGASWPVVEYTKLVEQENDRKMASLSTYDKECVAMASAYHDLPVHARMLLEHMTPEQKASLKDAELAEVIKKADHCETLPSDARSIAAGRVEGEAKEAAAKVVKAIAKRYPLLECFDLPWRARSDKGLMTKYADALLVYLNA